MYSEDVLPLFNVLASLSLLTLFVLRLSSICFNACFFRECVAVRHNCRLLDIKLQLCTLSHWRMLITGNSLRFKAAKFCHRLFRSYTIRSIHTAWGSRGLGNVPAPFPFHPTLLLLYKGRWCSTAWEFCRMGAGPNSPTPGVLWNVLNVLQKTNLNI